MAVAPAPGGDVYIGVGNPGVLYRVDADGHQSTVAHLPNEALSLAVDGDHLLLGMEHELACSSDGGHTWRNTGLPNSHYIATSLTWPDAVAVAWSEAIWVSHDGCQSWSRSQVAADYLEGNTILAQPEGYWYAATQLGLIRSDDKGGRWARVPDVPDRQTCLSMVDGTLFVGDWRGVVRSGLDSFRTDRSLPGGIWSLVGDQLLATTDGLYEGATPAPIERAEFFSVLRSGEAVYATEAGARRVYAKRPGGGWRIVFGS